MDEEYRNQLEELGQRVISPPPWDKSISDDAIKGQKVIPPAPIPESPQGVPIAVPSSPEAPKLPSAPTLTPQPSPPNSTPKPGEDSTENK